MRMLDHAAFIRNGTGSLVPIPAPLPLQGDAAGSRTTHILTAADFRPECCKSRVAVVTSIRSSVLAYLCQQLAIGSRQRS